MPGSPVISRRMLNSLTAAEARTAAARPALASNHWRWRRRARRRHAVSKAGSVAGPDSTALSAAPVPLGALDHADDGLVVRMPDLDEPLRLAVGKVLPGLRVRRRQSEQRRPHVALEIGGQVGVDGPRTLRQLRRLPDHAHLALRDHAL